MANRSRRLRKKLRVDEFQEMGFDISFNFPVGTGSPSWRSGDSQGFDLAWDYPDVLAAPNVGMDMPKQLNAGPVAARIAFFAPVSLLFFVTSQPLPGRASSAACRVTRGDGSAASASKGCRGASYRRRMART